MAKQAVVETQEELTIFPNGTEVTVRKEKDNVVTEFTGVVTGYQGGWYSIFKSTANPEKPLKSDTTSARRDEITAKDGTVIEGTPSGVALKKNVANYVIGASKTVSGRPTLDIGDYIAENMRGMSLDAVYVWASDLLLNVVHSGSKTVTDPSVENLHAAYNHLNPGMQRMSIGNMTRAAYNAFQERQGAVSLAIAEGKHIGRAVLFCDGLGRYQAGVLVEVTELDQVDSHGVPMRDVSFVVGNSSYSIMTGETVELLSFPTLAQLAKWSDIMGPDGEFTVDTKIATLGRMTNIVQKAAKEEAAEVAPAVEAAQVVEAVLEESDFELEEGDEEWDFDGDEEEYEDEDEDEDQ